MQDQNDSQTPDMRPEQQFDPEIEAPTQPIGVPQSAQPQVFQQQAQVEPAPVQPVFQQPVATQATQPTPAQGEATVPQATPAEPLAMYGSQPKRKKKWLIPVIALGIIVLAAGSASAYYFGVYQRPENVLLTAFNKATAAKAVQSDTTVAFDKDFGNGLKLKDIKLKANTANKQSGLLEATVNTEYKGKAMVIGGKAIGLLADGALYFQVNNVKQALQAVMDTEGTAGQVPSGFYDSITSLQDQWFKVTIDDVKKSDSTYGSELECGVNAIKKHSGDSNKEIVSAYTKNPFITVKESLGVKNNLLGYKIGFDKTKANAFEKSVQETQLYKDINACSPSGASSSGEPSTIDSAITDNTVYTLWIDQWSHELKSIEFAGSTDMDGDKTNYSGTVAIAYDPNAAITAPAGALDFDEFMKRLEVATEPLMSGVQSRAQTSAAIAQANMVRNKAAVYFTLSGEYPKALADFEKYSESSLKSDDDTGLKVTQDFPATASIVGYKYCSATNAQVAYFDAVTSSAMVMSVAGGTTSAAKAFCTGAAA